MSQSHDYLLFGEEGEDHGSLSGLTNQGWQNGGRDSPIAAVGADKGTAQIKSPMGALDILRKKADRAVRAMMLPVRQSTLTRNPFPELSSSPLTPTASHVLMDTSARSTPSSSPPLHHHSNLQTSRSKPVSRVSSEYDLSVEPKTASSYDLHSRSRSISERGDGLPSGGEPLEGEISPWTPTLYKKQLLFFYTDEENYRSLFVDTTTLVCDVCRCLVEKFHAKDDVNWVLTELNLSLNLERILEDHEKIHAITRYWGDPDDFRLYFKKDFRKFEPFRNPANFISPDMVDHGQLQESDICDLLPSTERYNHILLQHLFVIEKLPDILGHCFYKDAKKSWKKLFCVLKSSSLYHSNKGTNTEPKHLQLACQLSDVDIHTVTEARSIYSAPHPYCLCLKRPQVTEVKEMVFLCVDNEKSLLCWHTTLRLAKYRSQLTEDYKSAINYMEQLILKTNSTKMDGKETEQRVAMDFTGTRGRVVDDPSEAFGVACEEAQQWRKKVTGRCVVPETDLSRPAFLSSCDVSQQYTLGLGAGVHMAQPWFHSGISRQQAVELITKHGLIDGVFLVRDSQSTSGIHVLSLAHNHKVKHCQIQKVTDDGKKYYTLDGGFTKFTDLIQLVEFYQLNAAGLPTRLTHYVMGLP